MSLLHYPRSGNTASDMLIRGLFKHLVNNRNDVMNTTGDYDFILSHKEVCNDIIAVFLGDFETITHMPLGLAYHVLILLWLIDFFIKYLSIIHWKAL